MTLKNEIDKLIQKRRRQLQEDDQEAHESYEVARTRFEEVRPLLAELESAVDNRFVRIEVRDEDPRIYAQIYCVDWEHVREDRIDGSVWTITPLTDADDVPIWYLQGGYVGVGQNESRSFATGAELFEHLIPMLATDIAELQHEAEKRRVE